MKLNKLNENEKILYDKIHELEPSRALATYNRYSDSKNDIIKKTIPYVGLVTSLKIAKKPSSIYFNKINKSSSKSDNLKNATLGTAILAGSALSGLGVGKLIDKSYKNREVKRAIDDIDTFNKIINKELPKENNMRLSRDNSLDKNYPVYTYDKYGKVTKADPSISMDVIDTLNKSKKKSNLLGTAVSAASLIAPYTVGGIYNNKHNTYKGYIPAYINTFAPVIPLYAGRKASEAYNKYKSNKLNKKLNMIDPNIKGYVIPPKQVSLHISDSTDKVPTKTKIIEDKEVLESIANKKLDKNYNNSNIINKYRSVNIGKGEGDITDIVSNDSFDNIL